MDITNIKLIEGKKYKDSDGNVWICTCEGDLFCEERGRYIGEYYTAFGIQSSEFEEVN